MQIYLVGGAVRDKLLNQPVKDRDWVVVGATPAIMLAQGFTPVGKDFPVFLHPETREEYALARTERKTAPGYAGFSFHADETISLEDDLKRRDLTINAIAEDEHGHLIDPFNGQDDLQAGKLRHVSPAFAEDPVRILRIARFAARYAHWGFHVAHNTHHLMKQMVAAGEVDALVPERVWAEFVKALAEPSPERFFSVLNNCGALAHIMPELASFFPPKDAHSKPQDNPLINRLQQITTDSNDALLRFAALATLLNKTQFTSLTQRLKIPKDYQQLGLLSLNFINHYLPFTNYSATQVQTLLTQTDAFRRPQRFKQWLAVCQALTQIDAQPLQQALTIAQKVDTQSLATAGLKGAEFGEALQQQRIKAIAAFFDMAL